MKYRSSVTTFAKAALSEAAMWPDGGIAQFEQERLAAKTEFDAAIDQFLCADERTSIKAAKKAIPEEDWREIIAYIKRYHDAYEYRPAFAPWHTSQRLLVPWLASVAVCALDDIGR